MANRKKICVKKTYKNKIAWLQIIIFIFYWLIRLYRRDLPDFIHSGLIKFKKIWWLFFGRFEIPKLRDSGFKLIYRFILNKREVIVKFLIFNYSSSYYTLNACKVYNGVEIGNLSQRVLKIYALFILYLLLLVCTWFIMLLVC